VFAFPIEAELIGNGSAVHVEVDETFDFHSSDLHTYTSPRRPWLIGYYLANS
jgi:hypothetical protein